MTKDEQIDEMAILIHEAENDRCYHLFCRDCKYGDKSDLLCTEKVTAEAIYNAGYRKQSEVAREIPAVDVCLYCEEGVEKCDLDGERIGKMRDFLSKSHDNLPPLESLPTAVYKNGKLIPVEKKEEKQ